MARFTSITPDGDVKVCSKIEFEKNPQWTKILGRIPSRVQEPEGQEGADPESEYILQRLIELHPEVLPWDEFADSPKAEKVRVCVVCNEIPSASTDILLVEQKATGGGRFVIIETKLVKNPEIYREVLGQVLDYAAYLSSSETPESLENKAKAYWKDKRSEAKTSFQQEMMRVFEKDWREVIWESALENTRRKDIRLLIVSNDIPEQLRLAVTYLPSDVLLSAVELQAHGANAQPSASTGVVSADGTQPAKVQAALKEYFSGVTLNHATIQRISSGAVVSQAAGRGKATAPRPVRSYQDHLEKLGEDTAPGQALKMLKEKTEQTGSQIREGGAWLAPRLFGLPGLYVSEEDAELWVAFWPSMWERRDEARKIFSRHFDLKDKKDFHHAANWEFYFQPIKKSTPLNYIKGLVQRLEKLYEELRKLK